jgi:short-subunit dehydrogenase
MKSALGTAVVTGASAGIGKVYAERLAARSYDLILIARRGELLDAQAKELIRRYDIHARTVTADLSQREELERVIATVEADDSVSLLVNNAGTSTLRASVDVQGRLLAEMISVNILALTQLALAALKGFKARNGGILVNIGSVLGFHALPISSIYSGTKGYVLNFTRGLQQEFAESNVYIQLVLPAATATDLWEISGVPLSALDPTHVMSVADCVDAALSGLDRRELITMTSLEDERLFLAYENARSALFTSAQSGRPASRYKRRP